MNGLDAIKDRILSDARAKAEEINIKTTKEVENIRIKALSEVSELREKSSMLVRKESQNIQNRVKSLAIMEDRKIFLAAKQRLIEEIIEQSVLSFKNIAPTQKNELYTRMLNENILGGEIVQFNNTDQEMAKEVLLSASLPVSINPVKGAFAGGFIIERENIEINMTIDMIARQYRSELVSTASSSLFEIKGNNDGR